MRRGNVVFWAAGDACCGAVGDAASATLQARAGIAERRDPHTRSRVAVVNVTRSVVLAVRVQLALSGRTRALGLLGRTSLAEGEGLIIRPCKG
ncbi:MAG: hypothetical protein AB1563_02815, partial [Bacillota bacterium]